MKFSISDTKSGFSKAVDRSSKVALKSSRGKGFMPILRSVLIQADKNTGLLTISGTDADTTIVNYVKADIDEGGIALVDVDKLDKFLWSKPGIMYFKTTKVNLIGKTPNGTRITLRLNSVPTYPEVPLIPLQASKTSISGAVLMELFSTHIMASDKTGPLSAVYLSYGNGEARSISMSHYGGGLSVASTVSGEFVEILVPSSAANLITNEIFPEDIVNIYVDNDKVFFVMEYMYLSTVSISGMDMFPAERFIQMAEEELSSEAVFDADKFIEAVRACSDMIYNVKDKDDKTSEKLRIFTSVDRDGCLMKTSEKNEEGFAEYVLGVISFTGVPFDFILNAKYSRNIILSLNNLVVGMSSIKSDIRKKIIVGHSSRHIYFKSNYSSSVYVMAKVAPA